MKKILALVLVLAMVACVFGCAKPAEDTSATTTTTTTTTAPATDDTAAEDTTADRKDRCYDTPLSVYTAHRLIVWYFS